MYDVIIVGKGPAGISAALYTAVKIIVAVTQEADMGYETEMIVDFKRQPRREADLESLQFTGCQSEPAIEKKREDALVEKLPTGIG